MHTFLMSMQAHIGQLTTGLLHIGMLPKLKSWVLKNNFPHTLFLPLKFQWKST